MFVDNITAAWLPTNEDVLTIGYNQRLIISDEKYYPPLTWQVSKIENTQPFGLTQLKFTQETFDPSHDSAELQLANYFDYNFKPEQTIPIIKHSVNIKFNGKDPTIKVGGSQKQFVALFDTLGTVVDYWDVRDGDIEIVSDENYTIERDSETLKIKIAQNYNLIGKVLTITAIGSNGESGQIQVEVI